MKATLPTRRARPCTRRRHRRRGYPYARAALRRRRLGDAEGTRERHAFGAASHENRPRAVRARDERVQDPKSAVADHGDHVAGARCEHLLRVHDAGERFEKRRGFVRKMRGLVERVPFDDVLRHRDVLRVRAENLRLHHALAELFFSAPAPPARSVRRRMDRHDRVARRKRRHAFADRGDVARKFVPETGRHRHLRMAAPKRFEIRAVGQRDAHAHDEAAGVRFRDVVVAKFDLTRRDQIGGSHRERLIFRMPTRARRSKGSPCARSVRRMRARNARSDRSRD